MNTPLNPRSLCIFFVLQALFCISFEVNGQSKVHGVVIDITGKAVINANVLLLRGNDSLLVKGAITDAGGNYVFQEIKAGEYIISASFTGFQAAFSTVFNLREQESKALENLQLRALPRQLSTVTVQAKKPPFEQKIDRMVVNVQSSITSAGSTALDVLEKSPGIIVDRQNNVISMAGKDGVGIMINGKSNNMPASAVVQMLAGMNASNIEKIELITTPPANFDAEGNAGFINIVFKTNPDHGTNGSYSLTAGYAKGPTSAASINLNHRKGKFNVFGDYSFSRTNLVQTVKFSRNFSHRGKATENAVSSERDAIQQNHNLRLGLDYQMSKKTVLGGLLSSYNNKWSMDAKSHSSYTINNISDTTVDISIKEINHWKHLMANVYLQHAISNSERLSIDFDYLYYENDNPANYLNSYYGGSGNFVYDEKARSGKLTPISVYVGKADYFKQLGKNIELESGVKATISQFNNDVYVQKSIQDDWFHDEALSAEYLLKEKIAAAYSSLNVNASKKTNLKLGLRYEYTTSNLGTTKQANIVDRQYGNLFPSFFVSHKLNNTSSANFSYSRRITRPTFNELAPWVIFIDPNTFMSGNAAIQPSIANSLKWDYLIKKNVFSLAYTHEDDVIARFLPTIDAATSKQRLSSENLDNRKTLTLTLAVPVNVTSWWNIQLNAIGTWQQQNARLNNKMVRIEQKNYRVTASQNFTLPKNYALELSGFYQSSALVGYGIMKPFGALNFGAQKKLKGNSGSLRFNITDIFSTTIFRSSFNLPEHNLVGSRYLQMVTRTARLTYSKNFGSAQVKARKNRLTGSDEERKRVE